MSQTRFTLSLRVVFFFPAFFKMDVNAALGAVAAQNLIDRRSAPSRASLAKVTRRYPSHKFGAMYLRRGSDFTREMFGTDASSATAAQKSRRDNFGWVGQGRYGRYRRPYRRRVYRGRGGYFGSMLGKMTGIRGMDRFMSHLGDKMFDGSAVGRALDTAGKFLGQGMYTGQGEYESKDAPIDNSLISGDTLPVPHFSGEKDGASVTICHREYLGDLYAPPAGTSFSNQFYAINPGLERTFPWLAQIAANYEEYEIKQLIFTYRSTVADFAAATGQVGQVIMATQYNSNKEPFYEKMTMMQYDGAMSGKTSQTQMHGVECDPAKLSGHPGKYVRVGPVQDDEDLNDYDHAQFNIAVADCPSGYANQSIGEIWVSYTMELRKPKFFTGRGLSISRDTFVATHAALTNPFLSANSGVATGVDLSGQQNNIGSLFDRANRRITFPAGWAGNIKICVTIVGSGTAFTSATGILHSLTGNIVGITDYLVPTAVGSPWVSSLTTEDVNNQRVVYEGHFRIRVATGGVNNSIQLSLNSPGATGYIWSTLVDIQEYNLGFNYRLDGSNDVIVLQDASGIVRQPVL